MNAVLTQGIGSSDFKGLVTFEETEKRARCLGVLSAFGARKLRYGHTFTHIPYGVNFTNYGVNFTNIGIAESLKGIAVESAKSLSARLDEKINELANLQPNWDGEGAKPVKPHVLADVVETLKRLSRQTVVFHEPFLVPTFDGYLQIEWRKGKRFLDIEAIDKGWSAVGTQIGSRGGRDYFTAEFERNDFAQVLKFYQWLFGDELIWPSL